MPCKKKRKMRKRTGVGPEEYAEVEGMFRLHRKSLYKKKKGR